MPLLSKRVEIDTIVLKQPNVNLITLPNGVSSLTGLVDSSEEASVEEASKTCQTGTCTQKSCSGAAQAMEKVCETTSINECPVHFNPTGHCEMALINS